jgi:hypothetical protein
MTTARTLYARNAFAAAAIALISTVSVQAQTQTPTQNLSRADVRNSVIAAQGEGSLGSVAAQWGLDTTGRPLNAGSTLTRAEVRADAERAVASGEIEAQMGDSYGYETPQAESNGSLSRADVRADTIRAIRSGKVEMLVGESYGYGAPAKAL